MQQEHRKERDQRDTAMAASAHALDVIGNWTFQLSLCVVCVVCPYPVMVLLCRKVRTCDACTGAVGGVQWVNGSIDGGFINITLPAFRGESAGANVATRGAESRAGKPTAAKPAANAAPPRPARSLQCFTPRNPRQGQRSSAANERAFGCSGQKVGCCTSKACCRRSRARTA